MFVVCNRCHRHVRDHESACPFCGAARNASPLRLRVGLALAMGVTTTLACGGDVSDPADQGSGGSSFETGTDDHSDPGDSTPSTGGKSSSPKSSSGTGAVGNTLTLYGAPPIGGRSSTTDTASDGGTRPQSSTRATGGMTQVAYGVPPMGGHPNSSSSSGGATTGGSNHGGLSGAYAAPATTSGVGGAYGVPPTTRSTLTLYGTAPLSGGTGNTTATKTTNTMVVAPAYGVAPYGGNNAR